MVSTIGHGARSGATMFVKWAIAGRARRYNSALKLL